MNRYIPLILLVVTTNAISQILLKKGMNAIGTLPVSATGLIRLAPTLMTSPWLLSGLSTLVISTCLHLMVLSRVDISFAYPFLSIAYVLVLFSSYYLFSEPINASRIAGVGLICVGTFFVARS